MADDSQDYTEMQIVSGPSKEDLQSALFDTPVKAVSFQTGGFPETADVFIDGLTRVYRDEWQFHGRLLGHNYPIMHKFPKVQGGYSTKTSTGWLRIFFEQLV